MNTSEHINELAEALAAAQGEIEAAQKDAENPFFKSSYATLDSVWTACREPLSKHGLAIVQVPTMDESGLQLITRMIHKSGQWIEGDLILKPAKDDLQGLGSAITYGRRYMLGAIAGVATGDDDGNEASTKTRKQPTGAAPQQVPTNGDSKPKQRSKVETPEDLLKVVNSVDRVNNYYKNIHQLNGAIAKGLGVELYDWPAKQNVDGWREAFVTAKDYAVSAVEIDQTHHNDGLFPADEPAPAPQGAFSN